MQDADEKMCEEMLVCEQTGVNFRVIPQELKLRQKMGWPLPRVGWEARYGNRLRQRTPRKLWKRECMKCGKEIVTTYSPGRPEMIHCDECYLKEVY